MSNTPEADIGPSIPATFQQFKQMGGEFFRALPGLNEQEADSAFKCLTLAYVGLDSTENEQYQAYLVMQMAGRKMIECEAAA